MEELFWKLKYARHRKKRFGLTMREGLRNAESALENIDRDLDECPVKATDDEYYQGLRLLWIGIASKFDQ